HSLQAAESLRFADLTAQDMHGGDTALPMPVTQAHHHPAAGRVIDDGVVQDPKTAVADTPGRVAESLEQGWLGRLARLPKPNNGILSDRALAPLIECLDQHFVVGHNPPPPSPDPGRTSTL